MTEITVVIPAYNPGPYLRRALLSVVAQTHRTFDVLVIDDGSREDLSWVSSFDPRVRLLPQVNRGVSATRNRGAALARGSWVAFLDQDDEWLPTKLERQTEAVEAHPEVPFCSTGFLWCWDDRERRDGRQMDFARLASTGMVCLSTALVRRDEFLAVGGQNPLLHQVGDFDLFLKLSRRGRPTHVDEALVRYHYHGDNASMDYHSAYRERQLVLRLHSDQSQRDGDEAGVASCRAGMRRSHSLFAAQAWDAFRTAARNGSKGSALRHLGRCVELSPALAMRSSLSALRIRGGLRPGRRAV